MKISLKRARKSNVNSRSMKVCVSQNVSYQPPSSDNFRLTEIGDFRLTESGDFRILE